jgi:hypothetical protein
MRMRHFLPPEWIHATNGGRSILELGVQQIAQIPASRHAILLNAYRHAIATTFLTGAGIAALAFTIVLFLPELPLRTARAEES